MVVGNALYILTTKRTCHQMLSNDLSFTIVGLICTAYGAYDKVRPNSLAKGSRTILFSHERLFINKGIRPIELTFNLI